MSQILQEIFNRCYKVQLAPSQLILHKKKPSRNMLLPQNLCWYPTDTEKKSQLLSLLCKAIHSMDFINISKIPLTPQQSLWFSTTANPFTWQSPFGSCLWNKTGTKTALSNHLGTRDRLHGRQLSPRLGRVVGGGSGWFKHISSIVHLARH